jgi:type II secretory pathway component GspD/PulD (secretin)
VAIVKANTRVGRGLGLSGALLTGLLVLLPAARAQEPTDRPPTIASVLQSGRECYARGDYEVAAQYYRQVQANADQLLPSDRTDLDRLIRQNDIALHGQREGHQQLRQAEEALRHGQVQQAAALYKALDANRYLTPQDRQAVARLGERLRAAGDGALGPPTVPANADAKTLLSAARAAFQKGDLDNAEKLALRAKQLDTNWMHMPWSDTPAKVLRDVAAARARQAAARQAAQKQEPKASSGSTSPFQAVKNFFSGKSAPAKPADNESVSTPTSSQTASGYNANKATVSAADPRTPAERDRDTEKARKLLAEGYQALKKNDLNHARICAEQAQALHPVLGPTEYTPQRLLAEVRSRVSHIAPAAYAQASKDNLVPPPPAPTSSKSDEATEQARRLIRLGYEALKKNDLAGARRFAEQAQALRPDLKWYEDNPEKLLREIERRSPTNAAAPKAPPEAKTDAHALLKKARELLNQGKLDEAERVCGQAATAPNAHWGLFDKDTPDKLRADIQQARKRGDREEAARLLAEARRQFDLGHYKEAKELAARAKLKHGPYTILDLGDRPDRLLADIEMAEAKQQTALPPQTSGANPEAPSPAAQAAPADMRVLLTQKKVQMLMKEAQELEQQDRLIEARAKLLEAQKAAHAALAQGIRLAPGDETPEAALGFLSATCSKRVRALLVHADEMMALGAANPRHFEDAGRDLNRARQLATAFGQDLRQIEDKSERLQQLQAAATAGVPPIAPMPRGPVAENNSPPASGSGKLDGHRLLEDARRELRAGQLKTARRMAEAAMDPTLGVQEEAARLITSIDDEERNQKILLSNRNADALRDAYVRHDYVQAAILYRSIDWNDLSPDRRNHLREILSTKEMQTALAGPDTSPTAGHATASDLAQGPAAPGAAAENDKLMQYKLRQQVLFQKLRDEGLAVMASASKTFQAGNSAAAIDMLNEYLDKLNTAQLDAEYLALLKRPAEQRLGQLRTLEAQESFDKARIDAKLQGTGREAQRRLDKQHRQQTVADLMKQYDGLFKEGKYKECLVLLDQAREIDPENPAVNYAFQLTKYKARLRDLEGQKERKEAVFLGALDHDPGPYVDMGNPVAFDKDLFDRVKKRKPGPESISFPRRDEKERQIEQKLLEPTTVSFTNTPLRKVIEDLGAMHNLNIVADTAALEQANVSLDQPLSLKVSGISLKSALNLLLKQAHLTYIIQDQVLQVTTEEKGQGGRFLKVYPVADLVVPVENHSPPLISNLQHTLEEFGKTQLATARGLTAYTPLGGLTAGQTVSGQPVSMQDVAGGSVGNSFASSAGPARSNVQITPVSNTIEKNLMDLIKTTIAPESWADMGGKGTIQYYPLGLGLVVNQTQDVQEQVADLLEALRRLQDLEVAIEIRLVSVSESFFERMGLDFDVNIVTHHSNAETQLTTGNFQIFPNVNRFTPSKFGPVGLTPAGTFTPDLNIPINNSSFDFSIPPFGNYPGTLGADGGLELGLAFLSDIQVFMILEAAQGDQRVSTMQAPRVTVFNGQTAFIQIQTVQFFLIGVTISQIADQLVFTPQNFPIPVGITLPVTPVVTADRRFVRLSLGTPANPLSLTNLASANVPLVPVQIPVPQLFNDNFTNPQPVIFQMFFQQPTFETISVETTVMVPDGGTVLLGGLKTMDEGRNEFGPPILSKIPYINRLFKNIAYGRDARSLMIMVTPRIIINQEEEDIFEGRLPPLPRP